MTTELSNNIAITPKMKQLRLLVEIDQQLHPGGRRLKLHGADLDDLPPELFVMKDLEVLDLSPERQSCIYYHLSEVPQDIGRLVNLRVLMLDTNRLYNLPEELCQLQHLEKLSLSNNHLSSLPKNFPRLQALSSLHAANNEFVLFPDAVCKLPQLHFLDFSDNKLASLPPEIRKLSHLETLILFKNCLVSLPDTICELLELRMLWVGENQLKRLPRNITHLKRLDWGRTTHTISAALDGNPLAHPPLDVCKQGPDSIENYFRVAEPRTTVNRNRKPAPDRRMSDLPEEVQGGNS